MELYSWFFAVSVYQLQFFTVYVYVKFKCLTMSTLFRNSFFDYFWVKEPLNTPKIADYFMNHTIETIVMLCINFTLATLTIHVIWTQSAKLDSFKYYIWNQFVVSQAFEFGLLVHSPVLLSPYVANYSAGIFAIFLTDQLLYLSAFLTYALYLHVSTSVFLSLFNRFVFIFRPDLKEWLHKKKTLSFIAFFHLFFDALFALSAWGPVLDDETTEQRARKEASDSLDRWIHEKSFQYVPEYFGRTRAFIFLVLCVLVCLFFTLIVIVIWFIVNVFILKKTSQTLDNYSSYLLITVLVQTGASLVFFFLPAIVIAFCWAFAIENSGNVVNVALHVFIFNSILDMLIMMYFVKPYKLYLIGILRKVLRLKTHPSAIVFSTTHQTSSVFQ
uniref:Serpentine Receptor, class Z n=1 Tax=Panagrellus redivivus TaxID=6233 RepID=A0A7E4VMA6_PANRE